MPASMHRTTTSASPNDRAMLTAEVAEWLRIEVDTVRRWCREHRVRAVKVGRDWRISEKSVLDLLDFGAPPAATEHGGAA